MLGRVAKFEFLYQLRGPAFVVTSLIFGLFSFGGMAAENVTIGFGGAENFNSPYQIMQMTMILSLFAIFISVVFVSNIVLRDFDCKNAEIVFSTTVRKHEYLLGRFIGAYGVAALAFFSVPVGLALGSVMPWLDAERIGPFALGDFLYSFALFGLPTIFFVSGLFLLVSSITRSIMLTYVAVLAFLILWTITRIGLNDPQYRDLAALLDPFGTAAFGEATRYWVIAERNSLLVPLEGLMLSNRLLWTGAGIVMIALGLWRFRLDIQTQRRLWRRKPKKDTAVPPSATVPDPGIKPEPPGPALAWRQFLARTQFEVVGIVRSLPFVVLLVFAVFNTTAAMFGRNSVYGTDLMPVTRTMINTISSAFEFFVFVVIVYYASELVWRERQLGVHDYVDTTPTPNWSFVISKLIGMFAIVVAMFSVSILAAMIFQAFSGYTNFEFGLYVERLLYYQAAPLFEIAALAIFLQVLSNNKYFGMLLMIVYLIGIEVADNLGFENKLYQFAGRPPAPLTDMNGSGHFMAIGSWFTLYWGLISVVLAVLAYLMWNRGSLVTARHRMRQIRVALSPVTAILFVTALAGAGAAGGFIYYNTNILNDYTTKDSREAFQVEYEKKYRQYEGMPQPRIVDVRTEVDIYPYQRRYGVRGHYFLENETDAPITEVQAVFDPRATVDSISLEGAKIAWSDDDHNYYSFALDKAMAPGERLELAWEARVGWTGFANDSSGNLSTVVYNGTFIHSRENAPNIGFTRNYMLADRQARRDHGLDPIDRAFKLENMEARRNSYLSNDSDWVNFETTVSTEPDQIAIAPGYLEREWTENGRRYFHYKMDAPILNFFSYLSASYAVARDKWEGVDLAVYYYPPHEYNVQRMLGAAKKALVYYSANFSPYQYRQLRILEFPAYATFAQSFPNTVPWSEALGFIADIKDGDVDYVFYVTAHEIGHQWWAHQVMGANVQGGEVLVETLAQYSALMVMEHEYGPNLMRRFLKYELDRYLRGRGTEAQEEMPLERVEDQPYIHYRKGSLVMYAMKDYLGEDAVNRALANLIAEKAYQDNPYPTSLDLVRLLRAEAKTDAQQQLITDLFERITLFDLKVDSVSVTPTDDGRFHVVLEADAAMYEADGAGKETEIPLDMPIDIGLFAMSPADEDFSEDAVIQMGKQKVTSGKNRFEFTVDRAPTYAGIDPYNKLIDRNSDDNLMAAGPRLALK